MFFNPSGKNIQEPDERLIASFTASGDLEVLGVLFNRYMHLVYGVCLKYLKEREASRDATMQIFEKLIVELPKTEVENFKPWLHVMTKNHCLMQLRAQKSKSRRHENYANDNLIFMESSYEMHPNNESVMDKDLEILKKCIEQLKAEQKQCVRLFYLEEKCYKDISDELNLEVKKVKSYIQNGKRNLKICMESNA